MNKSSPSSYNASISYSSNQTRSSQATVVASGADVLEEVIVPTFADPQEPRIEVNLATLASDATSIDSLRVGDPFLYHTIFAPTGNLSRETVSGIVSNAREHEGDETNTTTVSVKRRKRISTEVDPMMLLLRTFPGVQAAFNQDEYPSFDNDEAEAAQSNNDVDSTSTKQ